jgi:acyl-CoA reductase-like NAD-dependent aldehyde dehydrogenase
MAPSATYEGNDSSEKVSFEVFYNVINGKLVKGAKSRHSINPATKKANLEVPIASEQDVNDTVDAAVIAFKSWSRVPLEERKERLLKYADAVKEHAADFAKLLTTEQGKPVSCNAFLKPQLPLYVFLGVLGQIL